MNEEDLELEYQKKIETLIDKILQKSPIFIKNCCYTLIAMYHSIKYRDEDEDKRNARKDAATTKFYSYTTRDFARVMVDDLDYLHCFIKYLEKFKDGEDATKLLETLQEYQKKAKRNIASTWATDTTDYKIVSKLETVEELSEYFTNGIRILIVLENPNNRSSKLLGVITQTDVYQPYHKNTDTAEQIMKKKIISCMETDSMQDVYHRLWEDNPHDIEQIIVIKKDGTFLGVITKNEAGRWNQGKFPK